MAGRTVDVDLVDRAVTLDGHRKNQCAIEFAFGCFRIIERTDAFDLQSPVFDVLGKAIFVGARADELLAWPLVVLIAILGDFAFQACHLQCAVRQLTATHASGGFWLRLIAGSRSRRSLAMRLRQQSLLLCFERLHALFGLFQLAAALLPVRGRQRCPGASVLIGVAAAVEVGLRQRLCIGRLAGRLAVDQNDFQTLILKGA